VQSLLEALRRPPLRRDIDHHRHLGGVQALHDFLGGVEQAARRIEFEEEAGVLAVAGDINGSGNVAGAGRADGAVDTDEADSPGVRGSPGSRRP